MLAISLVAIVIRLTGRQLNGSYINKTTIENGKLKKLHLINHSHLIKI